MDRQPPRATSDEIELYIRTYYSLLRSSGDVRVRAFEEPHSFSNSSLHSGALSADPDVAAFAYSAARLPACMPRIHHIVMGQSHEHFEAAGFNVRTWERVRTRGRRRPLRWDGNQTLAVFITSTSDIDDLVPIVTAYQVEWNKIHRRLEGSTLGQSIALAPDDVPLEVDPDELGRLAGLDGSGVALLRAAFDEGWDIGMREVARRDADLSIRLLAGSYSEYQRAAQRWWSGIEPGYVRPAQRRRPAVYFVSSNTHSVINMLGGYARSHRDEILSFARTRNPEGLAAPLDRYVRAGDEAAVSNIMYYLLRTFLRAKGAEHEGLLDGVQRFDAESGITSMESPGHIDVNAQIVDIAQLKPERFDPRIHVPGMAALAKSDAVIINIDYPLGMAAYHHLSRVAQGVGEIRGVYVMGKAATLNARVGDVMLSSVVYDEHSRNTFLLRNCFTAGDIAPYLREGSVFDSQKALTVRSAFLQNRDYMGVFYREGYTVLEMEAGPYLSAVYEIVNPKRHPNDEIVHLSTQTPFDVGVIHYASDTPYSRRQSLLSKSLSYFGVESTYACTVAILQRILRSEIARHS